MPLGPANCPSPVPNEPHLVRNPIPLNQWFTRRRRKKNTYFRSSVFGTLNRRSGDYVSDIRWMRLSALFRVGSPLPALVTNARVLETALGHCVRPRRAAPTTWIPPWRIGLDARPDSALGPRLGRATSLNDQSWPQTFEDVCPASHQCSAPFEVARNPPTRPFKAVARVQIPLGLSTPGEN
jgi:hypothetical protein